MVTPAEWNHLADLPGCVPQRSDDGEGTYAFCEPAPASETFPVLNGAAPGNWRCVA